MLARVNLLVVLSVAAQAATLNVPRDYARIQDAIEAAEPGDLVLVMPGTYLESLDFLGKAITVSGKSPEDSMIVAATVVDASQLGSAVQFVSGEDRNSLLSGLTLTGGSGAPCGEPGSTCGGGVYCEGSSPTLHGCRIVGNAALNPRGKGGGVYCAQCSPLLEHCQLLNNRSSYQGGAIYVKDCPLLELVDCTISGNSAGQDGGGIRAHGSSLRLTRCSITQNTSQNRGAGINCVRCPSVHLSYSNILSNESDRSGSAGGLYCSELDQLTLEHCRISDNAAGYVGGMVLSESVVDLNDCRISGNRATNGPLPNEGGGICSVNCELTVTHSAITDNYCETGAGAYCWGSAATFVRCTIANNVAERCGGGLYLTYSEFSRLEHCVIQGNFAVGGAAIYCYEESALSLEACTVAGNNSSGREAGSVSVTLSEASLKDCILWGNRPHELMVGYQGAEPLVSYCDVAGGYEGEGNIDVDPEFCNAHCEPLDFGLAADSPCRSAGSDGGVIGALPVLCEDPLSFYPATHRVPEEYESIASAVAASCPGDTVRIAPGTYSEHHLQLPSSGIVVTGWDPLDDAVVASTVIDGGGMDVIQFLRAAPYLTTQLSGVTVRGGGVGIGCRSTSPSIDHCVVEGNAGEWGGGLLCHEARPIISHTTIANNSASLDGGGLRVDSSSPQLIDCVIANNTAQGSGGGISCYDLSYPALERCVLVDNHAAGDGGACAIVHSSPSLTNCVIARNHAGLCGAGLSCEDASPKLTNCTLVENSATSGGGLCCQTWDDSPRLRNCIVWGNLPEQILEQNGAWPHVVFSDIQGGWRGEGNLDLNPLLFSARGFEYLLSPRSPCVDAGDPEIEDGLSDSDPRWPDRFPNLPRSDMGAYGGEANAGWLP